MAFGPLVGIQWLASQREDPAVAIVDCRFDVADHQAGRRAYDAGHIPGARFMDVERDLSRPAVAGEGRHPLPEAQHFETAARAAGIGSDTCVVCYDEAGEGGAARLWWLLRHFGHPAAAVLDGGFAAWVRAGEPVSQQPAQISVADFRALAAQDDTATLAEVSRPDATSNLRLVDARAASRFRGEYEPIDPEAGHIPGAVNVPFFELAPGGKFLPRKELRRRLGVGSDARELVAYCGSGVTACTVVLAAELAGVRARLYPGSWSEWSQHGLPRARGSS